jgi:hypothetical protein
MHYDNLNLKLSGQRIFPDWIKTLKDSNSTPVWNVQSAFWSMFALASAQSGDTGEPKFQDGTVLSSLGAPNQNTKTYLNRTDITVNAQWK